MNIEGKVALVTGAAGGIGRAIALELLKQEIGSLALVDQSPEVHKVAAQMNGAAGRPVAVGFSGDVADPSFRGKVCQEVREHCGVMRICVPAAGITRDELAVKVDKQKGTVAVYPLEKFRQVTEINLIAPVYWALEMVAGIAEDRKKAGRGRWTPEEDIQGAVVFIGSVSSLGNKGQIAYAAAKAGLAGVASTLMMEAIYYGVRSTIIHPGYTNTGMVQALGEQMIQEQILPQTQLRRLIQPEEIARSVCFMISNDTVSGALWADAGWHPRA